MLQKLFGNIDDSFHEVLPMVTDIIRSENTSSGPCSSLHNKLMGLEGNTRCMDLNVSRSSCQKSIAMWTAKKSFVSAVAYHYNVLWNVRLNFE